MDDPHPLHCFWTWGDGYLSNEIVKDPYTPEEFTRRLLRKCSAFVEEVRGGDSARIVEAYPFQLVARNHLRMGATDTDILNSCRRFAECVAPLQPLLIFLDSSDWETTLRRTIADRDDHFNDLFINSICRSPYGLKHGLHGLSGALSFYRHYERLVSRLRAEWPHPQLVAVPDEIGWAQTYAAIAR